MANKRKSHDSGCPKHGTWNAPLLPLLLLIMVSFIVCSAKESEPLIEINECPDENLDVEVVECNSNELKSEDFKKQEEHFKKTEELPNPQAFSSNDFITDLSNNFIREKKLQKLSINQTQSSENEDEPVDLTASGQLENPPKFWDPPDPILMGSNRDPVSSRKFRMKPVKFSCPPDKTSVEFHWHPKLCYKHQKYCLNWTNSQLSNMSILEDGKLVWNRREDERHVYRNDSYCVSRRGPNELVSFKVCYSKCNNETAPCVRKCCPPSQIIDSISKQCVSATPAWRPIFYQSAGEQDMNTEHVAPNASIMFGFPNCPQKYMLKINSSGHRNKYIINANPTNNFQLLRNGTLVQIDGVKHTYIKEGEFCIDGVYYVRDNKNGDESLSNVKYSRSEWDQVVIACVPITVYREIDKWRMPLYATLNHISALFLLVTDIVYILLWKHQNIHGWLQFAYATSLFCTFNCFVVVQRWSEELMHTSQNLCKVMGWITHLTYLSAFFWLTSMNFDLWWRFSRPLKSTRLRPQETKWRRFLGFAIFSIVIPLLISGIGITLDYSYDEMLLEPPFTIPGFGKEQCYFESKRSQIPYLYAPAGVLLLVDMIFFTSTVLHLRKIHAHTELARTQSTMEDKKGLKVIAKLFIVMGVLWIFELIKWIAYILFPEKEITLIWIFIPVDVLNSLQGVAIFFIFICKPNVGSQLLALFRKDDAGKTWNKQTQFPSVTVQQPSKQNEYSDIK
ncbi:unnamed protein product [Orchesella dallaii]|uniref:G-protein coupled receptors family 2 profile 2 domain-containing protein n=1 Tax=Orchesella dallaii TaxID=48710 RepID=A0ABP1RCH7_9HEXA